MFLNTKKPFNKNISTLSMWAIIWCVIFIFLFIFSTHNTLLAQQNPEDEETESYTREYMGGISFYTNGGLIGSIWYRGNYAITPTRFWGWGVEITNIKSPKEYQVQSQATGNNFILGKKNYLYVLRPQYSRSWTLFEKSPSEGIRIKGNLIGGLSIGFVTPYFIQYNYGTSPGNITRVVSEPYDPAKHTNLNAIQGAGAALEGFGQSKIQLGGHAKASITFDFGVFGSAISAIEAGIMVEGFPNKIEIMTLPFPSPTQEAENRNIFTSAFISLVFGLRR